MLIKLTLPQKKIYLNRESSRLDGILVIIPFFVPYFIIQKIYLLLLRFFYVSSSSCRLILYFLIFLLLFLFIPFSFFYFDYFVVLLWLLFILRQRNHNAQIINKTSSNRHFSLCVCVCVRLNNKRKTIM